jgi:chemotaxis protein CheX
LDISPKNQISQRARKALSDAMVITFRKMVMLELSPLPVSEGEKMSWDFTGIVGFYGDITGNCALRLSDATAREVITRLSGEPPIELSEVSDGVGELTNMIAGNAKGALGDFLISLSFPEVVRGAGHEIWFHRHTEVITLYFTSEIGNISVIAAFSDQKSTQG